MHISTSHSQILLYYLQKSHCLKITNFLTFSTDFCPFKIGCSGNTFQPQLEMNVIRHTAYVFAIYRLTTQCCPFLQTQCSASLFRQ